MHTVVRYLCVCAFVKVFLRGQRAGEEVHLLKCFWRGAERGLREGEEVERDDFNSQ